MRTIKFSFSNLPLAPHDDEMMGETNLSGSATIVYSEYAKSTLDRFWMVDEVALDTAPKTSSYTPDTVHIATDHPLHRFLRAALWRFCRYWILAAIEDDIEEREERADAA